MCVLQEERTLKKDCPKLKNKNKEPQLESNIAQVDGTDSNSSIYSLSITPIVYYSDISEWILDMCATYHVFPKRK